MIYDLEISRYHFILSESSCFVGEDIFHLSQLVIQVNRIDSRVFVFLSINVPLIWQKIEILYNS